MDCIHLPTYSIHFGELPKLSHDGKVLIITNSKIAGLHLNKLLSHFSANEIYCICLQDGEEYKNFNSIETILEAAFNHRLNRNSLMIALGGGVIGDMVGFAAGIFMRGIPYLQIPTTLLSQVDSSVGGKTGINNRFGKNLIGLFNPPKAVYIDTYFLQTLPNREFSAGVAEIIKMAICFDRDFFTFLQEANLEDTNILKEIIYRAVSIKAKVVLEDEREKGIRAALNYGHTFGHIIERLGNFSEFLHGEAVSIGMIMANTLALKLNLISNEDFTNIKNLLKKFHLPTHYKINNKEAFYSDFFLDKKSLDHKIKFILPNKIGAFVIKDNLPKELLLETLASFE